MAAGYLAIGFGGLIQQRLLAGILQQKKTDDADGIGRTVGKIIESGQIEGLALTGGLLAILACLETFFAGAVLFSGAGGGVHVSLFIGLLLLTLLLAAKTMTRSKTWTDTRLALTGDLVERIAGHRTRLAQESVSAWHTNEDRILERYLEQSRAADESVAYLAGPIPRAWLVIGLAGFLPAMLSAEVSVSSLAVGLGGILLGQQALHRLCQSIGSLIGAGVAWKQVRPLFQAGGEVAAAGRWLPPSVEISGLRAECINFCYQASARVVLNDVSLTVAKNERLLIEGDSGSGKSTLLSILTGLERPTSGLLLAGGMDIQTMGLRNWRKRIVYAPQFHQNHVFSGTFAFNLLMGRCWPPAEKDLHEAEAVCEELGLGGLLNRMPGGLFQMVGDTGWRLSQGERSRLFIARALLQQADFVVLDESFSSLDPENLEQAMHCVRMRAKALIVAAHP